MTGLFFRLSMYINIYIPRATRKMLPRARWWWTRAAVLWGDGVAGLGPGAGPPRGDGAGKSEPRAPSEGPGGGRQLGECSPERQLYPSGHGRGGREGQPRRSELPGSTLGLNPTRPSPGDKARCNSTNTPHSKASIWLDPMPTFFPLTLSDSGPAGSPAGTPDSRNPGKPCGSASPRGPSPRPPGLCPCRS
jgi:hypothetical protein